MQIVGPLKRLYPTTSANCLQWRWCYLWLNEAGETVAIEWCN